MLNENQAILRRTVSHQSFPPQVPQYTQQQTVQYQQPFNQSQRR